ncbi:MAG: hypothetical protein V1792_12990 [Pseudomonadota bacterium]
MAKLDDNDDLDALIDKAVDTFFVEEPGPDELADWGASEEAKAPEPALSAGEAGPTLDEAVDTLFMSSFQEEPSPQEDFTPPRERPRASPPKPSLTPDFSVPASSRSNPPPASDTLPDFAGSTVISSGDPDTDREIDLAVDTLFIEEPETPAPETTQLEVTPAEPFEPPPVKPRQTPPAAPEAQRVPRKAPRKAQAAAPGKSAPPPIQEGPDYDEAMAHEIQRHMHTLYKEASHDRPAPAGRRAGTKQSPGKPQAGAADAFPLRQLQEAILTLEWEISRRSVTVLANELRKVRIRFKDNVTVDFAALSMRVVLDYVVKRMSRAHPESIRFLLDITDYLGKSIESSSTDPLMAFHDILTRYEKYKSSVRKAEGIPDRRPPILNELSINDPAAFSHMVHIQALALKRAGEALASAIHSSPDPENLIRSFRFLVNRVVSRILESTREGRPVQPAQRKTQKKI